MDDLSKISGKADSGYWRFAPGRIVAIARLFRFALVGMVSTLIYAGVAFLLAYGLKLPASVASLAAFGSSALFSYFGHRWFTFRSKGAHAGPAARFAGVNLLAYGVAVLIPWLITDLLGYAAAISFVLVCILIPVMNYVLLNIFVFREPTANSS